MIEWLHNFPYSAPREQQSRVIDKVLNSFINEEKKYAVVDCGTGVGKSAIGLTIAKSLCENKELKSIFEEGAYFLTTQKLLQEQYANDFKKDNLISLYSSSNYCCSKDRKASCKDIQTALRTNSLPKKYDNCKYDCTYKKTKKNFIENKLGITNFSYFLTEKNYSQKIPNKKVLVIDEAHNLENELSRFIEISISTYFSEKILKLKVPKDLNTQFKVFNWIKNVYIKELSNKKLFIEKQLEKFGITSSKLEEFKKITNHYDMITSHEKKILQFISIYDSENWVFDVDDSKKPYKKYIFKPIDVSKYAEEYILQYADYVIFMSATILSHEGFALTLGLPFEKTVVVKEETPFPPENRPVIFTPAGSMSFKNIENTLPKTVDMINHILDHHDEKGIIHTHSIKVAEYIKKNLNRKHSSRILIAYGADRNKVLDKHLTSKKPTVLLSPSMAEGVDLKGDLSGFQVICKIPFPFLGDKVVKKKMHKWKWWYNVETMRTIIQSIGRSIRSENDKAVTYILDSDWKRLMSQSKDMLPQGFEKSYYEN